MPDVATRSEQERRESVRPIAAIVALIVVILAGVVMVLAELGHFGGLTAVSPATTVEVEKPDVTVTTERETVLENGTVVPTKEVAVTLGGTESTSTTAASDNSLLGVASRNPATRWILEGLLAVVAGFLAGAATQRILLGRYGLTLGSLTIAELPDVTQPRAATALASIDAARVKKIRISNLIAEPPKWWQLETAVVAPDADDFKFGRVAVEAAARDLARKHGLAQLASIRGVLETLAKLGHIDGSLQSGSSDLIAIGDEVFAGAEVAADAKTPLHNAYVRATVKFADLLRARPATDNAN